MSDPGAVPHVVLDMDGTIYNGSALLDCTFRFLAALDRLGIRHTLSTSNASPCKADFASKLHRLGTPAGLNDFHTAAAGTVDWLGRHPPEVQRVALLGTPSLCEQFTGEGLVVDFDSPQAVVVGFDTTLDCALLYCTAWWIAQGLQYSATHPELVCPTDQPTVQVDCGAICAVLNASTARPPWCLASAHTRAVLLAGRAGSNRPAVCSGGRLQRRHCRGLHSALGPDALVGSGPLLNPSHEESASSAAARA